MAKIYIKDKDLFAGGNRAALAVMGADPKFKSTLAFMDADRLEAVERQSKVDQRYKLIPTPADVKVGTSFRSDYKGDPLSLLKKTPWAGITIFERAGAGAQVDLREELRIIYRMLLAAASPFQRSGKYAQSFRFQVGGNLSRSVPFTDFNIAGITNVAAYASSLEGSRTRNIFRRVFTKVQARARKLGYDARYTFLLGVAEGSKSVSSYPAPVIQIGYLNTMRGKTGLQSRRRPVASGRWMPPESGWGRRRRDWRR